MLLPKNSPTLSPRILLVWLIALTAYRILSLLQPHMGLFFDEAYYFHWSQQLDWGYYSKPPMVAWVIACTTALLGNGELPIKVGAPILYSATAWIVYLMGKKLANERVGVLSGLVFSGVPLVCFNSMFITTDAPLLFFWGLSSWLFVCVLPLENQVQPRGQSYKLWLLWAALGVSLGLGTLSKYTFLALPTGLAVFALASRNTRLFLSPRAWFASALALSLLAANIFWNWQHDFVSMTHTKEIAQLDGPLINPLSLLQYLVTQFFVLGAVWSGLLFYRRNAIRQVFSYPAASAFLLSTMLPIFVVIGAQALLSRAFANWAGAFVVPASVLVGAALALSSRKILIVGMVFNLGLASAFYHWPYVLNLLSIEQTKKTTPYFRLSGWRELTAQVDPIIKRYPEAHLLSSSRELLAYVGYYSATKVVRFNYWNPDATHVKNHYDLKFNIRDLDEANNLSYLFLNKAPIPSDIRARFTEVKLLSHAIEPVVKGVEREIYIYKLSGFLGYTHD
jgi:4-amino-4-deoxy-L-arabinose transferase-like glycosyltransferase